MSVVLCTVNRSWVDLHEQREAAKLPSTQILSYMPERFWQDVTLLSLTVAPSWHLEQRFWVYDELCFHQLENKAAVRQWPVSQPTRVCYKSQTWDLSKGETWRQWDSMILAV